MVEVNGRMWSETDSLEMHGPTERVYAVRYDDDGSTRILFGDGRCGERLPRGEIAVRVSCPGPTGRVDLTARIGSSPRYRSIRIRSDPVQIDAAGDGSAADRPPR
jgi:hypothetical protein